jgi:hypothetical protein
MFGLNQSGDHRGSSVESRQIWLAAFPDRTLEGREGSRATYQLSTGQRRSVYVNEPENLFNAFYDLTDFDGGEPGDDMIRLEAVGWHRIIFINKSALDYVAIPTHLYKEGRDDVEAAELDATKK